MQKRCVASAVVLMAMFIPATLTRAQTSRPEQATGNDRSSPLHVDGWGRVEKDSPNPQNPAPAARHDMSGIWEPANDWRDGVQAYGAKANPSDGKHTLPMTPLGEKMFNANKPTQGFTSVGARDTNDPANLYCDRLGFPREDLYNLRGLQIVQTPTEVLMLYEYDQAWRTIWTDGRTFPKDWDDALEPRWYGYSIGKWVDDTTLVVDTVGTDERTWIDNAGRPHSDELQVEERFHRVNHDIMELTVTITDPKIYTKPWLAKFPMRLQPADFDIREMVCSPSELADYLKTVGNPEGGRGGK